MEPNQNTGGMSGGAGVPPQNPAPTPPPVPTTPPPPGPGESTPNMTSPGMHTAPTPSPAVTSMPSSPQAAGAQGKAEFGEEKKEGSMGALIASIIIIVILVIGALYFWGRSIVTNDGGDEAPAAMEETPLDEVVEGDSVSAGLNTQGETDALDDIDSDLDGTNLDNLDEDVDNAEAAF